MTVSELREYLEMLEVQGKGEYVVLCLDDDLDVVSPTENTIEINDEDNGYITII